MQVMSIVFPDELNKLRVLLREQNINYRITVKDEEPGSFWLQIAVDHNNKHWSVIYWTGSYGFSEGLLEIGDLDNIHSGKDPQVEGYLTAQDCIDIITGKRELVG